MSLSDTAAAEWKRVLEKDDGLLARSFLETGTVRTRDRLLEAALSYERLPGRVMKALLARGVFDKRWMGRMTGLDKKQLTRALIWRAGQVDEAQFKTELEAGFNLVMGAWHSGHDYLRAEQRIAQVLAFLDIDPQLSHQQGTTRPVENHHLFPLAIHPEAGSWLGRSGMALEVLSAAARKGLYIEQLAPRDDELPGQRFDQWLDSHPALRAAWREIERQDQWLMDLQKDWDDTWLPEKKWKGSPLETWCRAAEHTFKGSPLDHPAMALPWNDVGPVYLDKVSNTYQGYLTNEWQSKIQGTEANRAVRIALYQHKGEDDSWTLWGSLAIPLDALAGGLLHKEEWASQEMIKPHNMERLGRLLKDGRVWNAIGEWKPSTVVEWILKNPAWITWRDGEGNSLLDIRALTEPGGWGKAKLSKTAAVALARKAPQMLSGHNGQGQRSLTGFSMDPVVRSEVDSILLRAMVEPSQNLRARPKTGRAM